MGYAMAAETPGGAEVIHRIEIGDIVPAAGEVVIEHEAIGVNFLDIYIRTGAYPWPVEKDLILGSEGAGIVTAVGAGVTHLSVGDRVAYTLPNGAYATHRAINADMVVRLPDAIASDTAAAIMLKGLTVAYLTSRSYAVGTGDTVLFHAAAGGVGLLAGQWMKSRGATVIGTAGGAEKCALARANGYDHVIDYQSQDFAEEVMKLTDGAGVNFGQSSGAYTYFQIKALAAGSLYLTRPTLFHFATERAWLESASAEMFAKVADGTLNVSINKRAPLDTVAAVHEALATRQTTGCTVLTV